MKGTLCHELEVGLPAGEVWDVYGSLQLPELVIKLLPNVVEKAEPVEGDGGAGTVVLVTLSSGIHYKEKFVTVDNERRIKEAMVIEGGYLELGFNSYLVRFEIIEKDNASSIIRSTIEYEVNDEFAANASLVTTGPLAAIAEATAKYLVEKKATA